MKFSVQHATIYTYASPVWDSFNDAHLCPVSDELQRCEFFQLKIKPENPSIFRRLDFWTNPVHHFEVTNPHDRLEVTALSVVETFRDTRDLEVFSDPSQLAGLNANERYYDFLHASDRVALVPFIINEAGIIAGEIRDVRLTVQQVMAFIHETFKYAPGTTRVESSVVEVFHQRRGVCQDFAHLMIAFCRALGIPSRYVSGYFYVDRVAIGTLDDNSVSHAWVECFLPGIGWVGYDPTHNRRTDETYIKVAVGRDYADVRPLAGTYRGGAEAEMEVSVRVERFD